MARQRFIIGNWKMHGSYIQNGTLLHKLKAITAPPKTSVVILPPFVYLSQLNSLLKETELSWGAQNVSEYLNGAFTGEISISMLKEMGCSYVLVGHSERRSLFHEDNECVARKFQRVIDSGLHPILCVGETKEQREAGLTEKVVLAQLESVINLLVELNSLSGAVIAYEPVWAIGTGLTATPTQAQEVHTLLRQALAKHSQSLAMSMPIIYGGSVKPDNAKALFKMPDIDGALVGGASLDADAFSTICHAME